MKKTLFILAFASIVYSCTSSNNNKNVSRNEADTLIIGKYNEEIGYFTFEHKGYPIVSIADNQGKSLPRRGERNQIILKDDQSFFAKVVGFKDRNRFYPLLFKSEDIEVDSIDLKTGYYKMKLLKDTVRVDLILDCRNIPLYLLIVNGDTEKEALVKRCEGGFVVSTEEFVKGN